MEDQNSNEITTPEVNSDESLDNPSLKAENYLSDFQRAVFFDIGKWSTWSGLVLFIMTVMSLVSLFKTYSIMGNFGGITIIVIMVIILLLYLFMALSAYKFGTNLKKSSIDNNPDNFYIASNHLLAFFQITGIPLMILVVIYVLFILFAVIFGGLGAMLN